MSKPQYPIRRRRTYLLSTFQSRFAFSFAVLSALVVLLTLFLIYRFVAGSGGAAALFSILLSGSNTTWLAGAVLILLSGLFGLFIAGTLLLHRIAGPVYILTRYMSELAEGKYPMIRALRSKDELVDFYLSFKRLVEQIRQREFEEAMVIREALHALGQQPAGSSSEGVVKSLKVLMERKLSFGPAPKPPGDCTSRALSGAATGSPVANEVALTSMVKE